MILDALKRADRERRQQDLEVPTLDTSHGDRPLDAQRRRRWLLWAGPALVVVLVAAGLAWFQSPWRFEPQSAHEQPEGPGQAQAKRAPDSAKAGAIKTQPAPDPMPQKLAIDALYQEQDQPRQDSERKLTREEIANLYRQAVNDSPESAASDPEAGDSKTLAADTPASSNQATPASSTKALTVNQPSTATPPVSGSPQAGDQPKAKSGDAPDETRKPALNGLPQIHTLPQSMQRNIPSINYQEHHYQPGGGSWVRLNRERKRVGDQLNSDLRIESIDEEGLVLNYRGRSFRLRALNSWINM